MPLTMGVSRATQVRSKCSRTTPNPGLRGLPQSASFVVEGARGQEAARFLMILTETNMTRDWHSIFSTWAKPPSETEEEKASNAARMINQGIRKSQALSGKNFVVYASGSYRNNTNTRSESDIDVAVVLKDSVYYELPADGSLTKEMLGFTDLTYSFTEFREDVGRALTQAFGVDGVTAGDKAFDVHENTYRLDADVSVFLEHRWYTGAKGADGAWFFHSGAEMRPRGEPGRRIINWHQQHYDEGIARNNSTRRRFKRVVRILKRLREEMRTDGSAQARAAASDVPSFLIECLCYNASDSCFNRREDTYYDDVAAVISELWNFTGDPARTPKLLEVSRMKWLFGSGNRWKPEKAREFLLSAWQYVGFK